MLKYVLGLLFLSFGICAQDVSLTKLQGHIQYLTAAELEGRACGTPGERKAAEYIRSQLVALGIPSLPPYSSYFQSFSVRPEHLPTHPPIATQNVIGFINNHAPTTIILGGHYDHLGRGEWDGSMELGTRGTIHPGADDNASGVAGLLELVKQLAHNSIQEKHNYVVVFFGAEEIGLQGSRHFVQNLPFNKSSIHCMINVDMIGRFSAERQLLVRGMNTSQLWSPLTAKANQTIQLPIRSMELGVYSSDHLPFFNQQIPILSFSTGVHEDYHRPTDTEDKIDYFHLSKIVQLIHNLVVGLEDSVPGHFQNPPKSAEPIMNPALTLGFIPDYGFSDKGVKVDYVTRNRPACQAGIQPGDVLIRLKDIPVYSVRDYLRIMSQLHQGEKIEVILRRDDTLMALQVAM